MPMELPYAILAGHYDTLFAEQLKSFRRVRNRLLRLVLKNARSVCDLACGPGNTAIELARKGFRVFAVDLSPQMCQITREKADRLGVQVDVMEADMRAFRLPEPVDLVICEFDALNHVSRRRDLGRVARSVAKALRAGGFFYFDVNNLRAFQEIWPGTLYVELEGSKLVVRGGYDKRRRRGWSEMHWFLPQGDRLYSCHTEAYREVCWSDDEISQALGAEGFVRIQCWDSSEVIPDVDWVRPGCRSFYLASRK